VNRSNKKPKMAEDSKGREKTRRKAKGTGAKKRKHMERGKQN
jgi:hypothetical protein